MCPDLWRRLPRHKWPKSWTHIEDHSGSSWTKSIRTLAFAGLLWERQFEDSSIGTWMGQSTELGMSFVHRKPGSFLSVYVDDIKKVGKKQNMAPMWKKWLKKRGSWRTNIISWPRFCWDAHNVDASRTKSSLMNTGRCSNHELLLEQLKKIPGWEKPHAQTVEWSNDLGGHAKKCFETYCELANKIQSSYTKSQPNSLRGWPSFQGGGTGIVWRTVKSMLTDCLEGYCELARIGRPDVLWSVDKHARAVTKWTGACDRRSVRLISYIHHTNDYRQYCHVGNTAQHCWLVSFQDSDFAGDLEDSKSTSGRVLCIFGSRTFVSISWKCKK